MSYNREKACSYALGYALGRNPRYYDFSQIGGDCTNFVSQCLFAGTEKMDYLNWYYIDINRRSPSWTGVVELGNFLLNQNSSVVSGRLVDFDEVEKGDVIQLYQTNRFNHSLFVTQVTYPILSLDDILISTHTLDKRNFRLSQYGFSDIRFIKIFSLD